MKPMKPTETIRRALLADGRNLSELALASGVSVAALSRMARKKSTIGGENLDRLLPVLGLELRPVKPANKGARK